MLPEFEVFVEDDADPQAPGPLETYRGALKRPESPVLRMNFVSTIDGVVALPDHPRSTPGDISLKASADRFVMGLLRATADCVIVGASTLRHDARHQWTAAGIFRGLEAEWRQLRAEHASASRPAPLIIVTASGHLPADHPAIAQPATEVLVVTTESGATRIRADNVPVARIIAVSDGPTVPGKDLIAAVTRELSPTVMLCEGGPTLIGSLAADDCLDELFLTIAPHLAGRSHDAPRPGLLESLALPPGKTLPARIRSIRRSGDHLFLRYALNPT